MLRANCTLIINTLRFCKSDSGVLSTFEGIEKVGLEGCTPNGSLFVGYEGSGDGEGGVDGTTGGLLGRVVLEPDEDR